MVRAHGRLRSGFIAGLIAVAATLSFAARATDYTDIWWAGLVENGWGVNLVQNEDVVFATFYIYDGSNQPTWYSSPMFVDASGTYSGTLYVTTGPWFGGPWSGSAVATPVGTSVFTPTSATTGTLTYTVNNVGGVGNIVETKNIERSTFRTINLGGNYAGTALVTLSGCADSANNGTTLYDIDPQVMQPSYGYLRIDFVYSAANLACTMTGAAFQEGQLFRIPSATYTCAFGTNTVATVYEVKATALGIEGRWTAKVGGGCQEDGKFSALLR
jgi:hypothetical protein